MAENKSKEEKQENSEDREQEKKEDTEEEQENKREFEEENETFNGIESFFVSDADEFEDFDESENTEFSSRFSRGRGGDFSPILPHDEGSFDINLEEITQNTSSSFNNSSSNENSADLYVPAADSNYQFSQYEENQARKYSSDREENTFDPSRGLIETDGVGFEERETDLRNLIPGGARGMDARRSELEDFRTEQKKYEERIEEGRKLPFERKRR